MQSILLSMVSMSLRTLLASFAMVGFLVVTALDDPPQPVDSAPAVTYYPRGPVSRATTDSAKASVPSVETGPITTTAQVIWADEQREPVTMSAQEVPVEEPVELEVEEPGIFHHCPQWEAEAVRQGWPIDQLNRLDHIMWRESRCLPDAHNTDDPTEYGSRGLLQINGYWCSSNRWWPDGWLQTHVGIDSCDDLFDPAINLRSALFMYNNSGWNPWSATDPGTNVTTLPSTP